MPKNSKSRIDANNRYTKKAYDAIRARSRKEDRLPDLIAHAAQAQGKSFNAYTIDAIKDALKRDGVTIDDLPPAAAPAAPAAPPQEEP